MPGLWSKIIRKEMLNLSLPFCVALYKILTSLGSFMSFARCNSGSVCLLLFLSLVVIAVVNLLTQTCREHDTQKSALTFRGKHIFCFGNRETKAQKAK